MKFGKNFREARKQIGYSQKEVAEKLNIHQSNVSDWENDVSRPEYEKLIELSRIYDISIDDLLKN
ncbi:MAG: helix-turn-helix transcriptional regulator [Clostridia bacterium]|nr:helix-turn-helix transcriptional regulator [Clostridia bacterium]